MAAASLERLYRALEVEYGGGGSSRANRGEARLFLQSVQETPEMAFHAASAILLDSSSAAAAAAGGGGGGGAHRQQPDFAVMFGLSCLEKLATSYWNELSDSEKLAVRSTAAAAAGRTSEREASYVRNKKASVLAHVALRDFPQRWPTFVDELIVDNDAILELSLVALTELADDCTDADYNGRLPAKRRTDVLKALNTVAPTLVGALFSFVRRAYARRTERSAEDAARIVGSRRLAVGLRCVRAFATWVCWDSDDMRAYDPVELSAYLAANGDLPFFADSDVDVCSSALAALRSLAGSAHLDHPAAVKIARSTPRFCEALYAKGCTERLELWVNLASTVSDIFQSLCNKFKNKKKQASLGGASSEDDDDGALASFLGAAISVLEAVPKSRKTAEAMLPLWRDAARSSSGKQQSSSSSSIIGPRAQAEIVSYVPRLLDRYSELACRRGSDDSDEFIDDDEYSSHFNLVRGGVSQVVAALVDVDAPAVARAVEARLRRILVERAEEHDQRRRRANEGGGGGDDEWIRRVDGLALVLDRVVDATLSGSGKRTEALTVLDDGVLAAVLFEWPTNMNDAVALRLALLDAARAILIKRDSRLRDVLRELFTALTYSSGDEKTAFAVRRKAAQTLLRLADAGPVRGVAAQFDELRDGASAVLSSNLLDEVGAQHVCEALVLFSNACADPEKRRALLEAVVVGPIAQLESPAGAAAVSSPRGFLISLGVLDASTLGVRFDARSVRAQATTEDEASIISNGFASAQKIQRALSTILGVSRRAAARAPAEFLAAKETCAAPTPPPGLADLAATDASAAVLVRALPPVISLARSLHALWAPPIRDALRADPVARLALAPSLDELRAKIDPNARRGSKNGPAAAELSSTDSPRASGRSDDDSNGNENGESGPPPRGSRAARWAAMLNELRSSIYQLARLWIERRCAFAPDAAPMTVALLSACGGLANVGESRCEDGLPSPDVILACLEHRHLASLLKHVLEPLFVRCPPALYESHLAPVARRVARHLERCLALSFVGHADDEREDIALAASANPGDEAAYYGVSGLCMLDWDASTLVIASDTLRRELARAYLDVLQIAFATKGDLASPVTFALKNLDKLHAEALAAGDASSLALLPPPHEGKKKDDGAKGARVQAAQARRAEHVSALRRCLLPSDDGGFNDLAAPVLRTLWSAVGKWGDVASCRAATKLAEVCVSETCRDPRYWPYLAALFESAVEALVAEPAWLANAGCEYEFLALGRAVYVALVIGVDPGLAPRRISPDTPMRHDGPRRYALNALPGVTSDNVASLENALREPVSAKEQKAAVHDLVLVALNAKDKHAHRPTVNLHPLSYEENVKPMPAPAAATPTVDSSALRDQQTSNVRDLPGVMIGSRQLAAQRSKSAQTPFGPHGGGGEEPGLTTDLADLFR